MSEPAKLAAGLEPVAAGGLVLLGCGKMGGAMLDGWFAAGLPGAAVHVVDPALGERAAALTARGARCGLKPPDSAAAVVVAVKPQLLAEALPAVAPLAGPRTLFMSIAAGAPLSYFEARLAAGTPIVRAMPNTPAAVGRGVTALFANAPGKALTPLAEALAGAVGETVRLESEAQMDAVTAVSGSGPAYVFHMIEALAAAGVAEGLPEELAMRLARATVTGAGELAHGSPLPASALREAVTSPAGTTAAGLSVLMGDGALIDLMRRTVAAAAARSRELGG
ncbi:pyrroline-5-carboxylate reductase [Rubrimonas cliftonensis]|uniref:Pyrroline-5-carboxylate reductase n=1 Tax=Rubrimonas cliftonensis TaxID=89524 RepID=A0A1H3VHY4_9RHOB|nr:pyrroline-5-carboxylate reductase [Rubrimonas cliftonensis]SDZ74370.1 pyrroline-5-carboxylate reductase [Rubrimonas cliftonensis]